MFRLSIFYRTIFSICILILFFAFLEILARVTYLDLPKYSTVPLPEEKNSILNLDPELFWVIKPYLNTNYRKSNITTNSLGLRNTYEIEPKTRDEFRVLSLGESTTFGIGVNNDQTYSYLLRDYLQRQFPMVKISVMNAGVPAYSSFQSLLYLKKRGLNLKPDLILFYHEINDYLPSSLRDSSNNEIGIGLTDQELYFSRNKKVERFLIRYSSLVKIAYLYMGRLRLSRLESQQQENKLAPIGISGLNFPGQIYTNDNGYPKRAKINEKKMGPRVSAAERKNNLLELFKICRDQKILLIVVHPSYKNSSAHSCLLTELCKSEQILMFESFTSLHPERLKNGQLFIDSFHPDKEGHKNLATNLARFIDKNIHDLILSKRDFN